MKNQVSTGRNKLKNFVQDLLKRVDFNDEIETLRCSISTQNGPPVLGPFEYYENLKITCRKFNLSVYPWADIIDLIVRNGPEINLEKELSNRFDACTIRVFTIEKGGDQQALSELDESFPVAIAINPYATVDDIKSFLSSNKDLIRSLLESHQVGDKVISHYKRKNQKNSLRDDFIFLNRDKKRADLVGLVNKEFGILLGYNEINTIISREKKRRKM